MNAIPARDPGLEAHDQIKLILIAAIAERIVARYPTQAAAGEDLGYDRAMISRLMAGEVNRFSVDWLVTLAYRLGLEVSLEVDSNLPVPPGDAIVTEIQH
jgi:predicted XRE-type DNA-binding protein